MDGLVMGDVMGRPSLIDRKNDNVDCPALQKDKPEVTIKKEIENDQEGFSEIAVLEQSTDTPEHLGVFEGDSPELKIFLEKEETMNDECEKKNIQMANDAPAEEDFSELEEKIKLEDFEFHSVNPSTSTGMINFKSEGIDRDDSFHEERMSCPIVTEDSASEGDPLELRYMLHCDSKEEVEFNLEEPTKKKSKKLINKKPEKIFQVHKGKKSFPCEHCQKCYSRYGHLKLHLRTHTGEKLFTCEQCQNSFSRHEHLKMHLRIHTGEKPFTCEHCPKSFSQHGHLKFHLRTHTEEKPFICEHCQKCFSRHGDLKYHLRTHTGERPFTCEYCQKCFSRHEHLKTHLRTHSREKPFTCEYCLKSFSVCSNWKRHFRIHKRE